jgi:membrane associated rhomboid family serine protease
MGANILVFLVFYLPLAHQPVNPSDPLLAEYFQAIQPNLPPHIHPVQVLRGLREYDLFLFAHGYKPGAAQWSDLLFSMFLHGGVAHLAGNMLFLWIYGDNVEHRLGRIRFAFSYLVAGAAATLFFGAFASRSMVPMVGASGAISGVLGLYFLLFPRNKVKVFFFLFPFFMDTILLPARLVLGMYLLFDNLLPFVIGAQSGVAHGAHIGGFLAGLGIAFAGERFAWQGPGGIRVGKAESSPGEPPEIRPPREQIRHAIRSGDPAHALDLASRTDGLTLVSLDPAECVQLASWMEEAGYGTAAARLLRGCLSRHRDVAEVYLQLGLLRLNQGQVAAAYQHLLDALDHDPDPVAAARAREALQRI